MTPKDVDEHMRRREKRPNRMMIDLTDDSTDEEEGECESPLLVRSPQQSSSSGDVAATSFLEKHEDFVLKLNVVNEGATHIVPLPDMSDGKGGMLCGRLRSLAVEHLAVEHSMRPLTAISLTFYDNDNDLITIASANGLVHAIEQFSDKKHVKIAARVKPKPTKVKTENAVPDPVPSSVASLSTTTTTAAAPLWQKNDLLLPLSHLIRRLRRQRRQLRQERDNSNGSLVCDGGRDNIRATSSLS